MNVLALVTALANIVIQLLDFAKKQLSKKRQEEYRDDVKGIEEDPISYANKRYGSGLSNGKSSTELRSDSAEHD